MNDCSPCEMFRSETFYRVDLPSGVDAGKEVTLDVEMSFSHSLHPYPTHITQSEHQHVRFIGNVYFYSPYRTQSLTTVVSCATSNIESYTREKPVSASEKTVTYGPYDNVEPFKQVTVLMLFNLWTFSCLWFIYFHSHLCHLSLLKNTMYVCPARMTDVLGSVQGTSVACFNHDHSLLHQ